MIFRFTAGLFGIACDFTHKYAPFQSVQVGPHPDGGAYLCSTDRGHIAFFAHDPEGSAAAITNFLPDKEISAAARLIKTAERTLEINLQTQLARVTTHQKTADKVVEFRAPLVSQQFPPLFRIAAKCDALWAEEGRLSPRAGCYDPTLIKAGMAACATLNILRTDTQEGERVILSSSDGGPMLLEVPSVTAAVLVMPHGASALSTTPGWLGRLIQARANAESGLPQLAKTP
jgi:hypothetical protein